MDNKSVLLGMSGGVDSSMSALLLQKMGYKVTGVTLKMYDNEEDNKIKEISERCGIDHFYIDIRIEFRKIVIQYFINEYKSGRTPSPCFYCNENIKFPVLIEKANELGIKNIATGHYVNKVFFNNKFYISKGKDERKDQSYYLWRLNQDVLERIIFPLGELTKEKVKLIAKDAGFEYLNHKKESMGVCFLKNRNYKDFFIENFPDNINKITGGDVYSINGDIIGKHNGYPYYTIGQKSGMELKDKKELYIKKIDPLKNVLIVDEKQNLNSQFIELNNYYFHNIEDIKSEKISAKVRGLGLNPEGFCKINIINRHHAHVQLQNPAWAVAPGQPVVFYIEDRVIGGGICE